MRDETRREFISDVANTGIAAFGSNFLPSDRSSSTANTSKNEADKSSSTVNYMANLNGENIFVTKNVFGGEEGYSSESITFPTWSNTFWDEENIATSLISAIKSGEIDVASLNQEDYNKIVDKLDENPYCEKGINHNIEGYSSQRIKEWYSTTW